jgi:hypothetical protein
MNSSKLSVEELIHLGKLQCRVEQYEEALSHFLSAYEQSNPPSVDLLDCLAAVSLKLSDLKSAMQYAVEMTVLYERSALVC